ncbi:hypothetical protein HDU79_009927, partial [Rhizoclosmatium sp. JEL0117]
IYLNETNSSPSSLEEFCFRLCDLDANHAGVVSTMPVVRFANDVADRFIAHNKDTTSKIGSENIFIVKKALESVMYFLG